MTGNEAHVIPRRVMTPDAHMVETLRLRTAALHRVSRSNDLLRRENDDLRARLDRVETLADQWERVQVANRDAMQVGTYILAIEPVSELRKALDGTP